MSLWWYPKLEIWKKERERERGQPVNIEGMLDVGNYHFASPNGTTKYSKTKSAMNFKTIRWKAVGEQHSNSTKLSPTNELLIINGKYAFMFWCVVITQKELTLILFGNNTSITSSLPLFLIYFNFSDFICLMTRMKPQYM